MMHLWRFVGLVLWGFGFWSMAQAQPSKQEADRVQTQVQEFLAQQADLQGRTLRFEWPRRRVKLPACSQDLSLRLADPQKTVGWVKVVARCPAAPGTWERVLQVRVNWSQKYLAAARNLMPGEHLSVDDLVWAEADSARLGEGVAQDLDAVLGQELRRPLVKGSPLKLNTLRPLTVIQKGSQIVLIMRGQGFEIETQGQALDNAPVGGALRVQIKEGTILSAKAIADGLAEAK